MRILLITGYFPPDVGSASHLFADIGGEFVRWGHRVRVVTNYPSYNVDINNLPERYRKGWKLNEAVDGMEVLRMRPLGMPRHVPWLRGLDQIASAVSFVIGGMWFAPFKPDVILVYSPPLFFGLSGLVLRLLTRAKLVVNIQDLFPQQAIDLGLIRNPMLIRIFRRIERVLYRRADTIAVHSPGNMRHILRHGGHPDRLRVVPNVVNTDEIRPGERVNEFRRRYGIPESEFVVSFGGVLGYNQDLDTVIEAARLLTDIPDLKIYIVGDGVEKPRLMQLAHGLANVRFIPMIPKEEYIELLHATDVGLVNLRSAVKTPVVPSKILSLMSAGRAMVASLPVDGDAPALIREAKCGVCVEPEDPTALAGALRALHRDRAQTLALGANGRGFAEARLTLAACAQDYEKIFTSLTSQLN